MRYEDNVLITGATGNLGGQILKLILLDNKKADIFLLIRAGNKFQAKERVISLLKWLFGNKYKDYLTSNIKVLVGDISHKNFGLSDRDYQPLLQKIDIIYHSAALTRFHDDISKLRLVNVEGTRRVLDFISHSKKLPVLHYISTAFIVGNFKGKFKESDFDVEQDFGNPYEQSKFEAEGLIRSFNKKRRQAFIYRPSIIVGEYETGAVTSFQMFYHPLYLFSKGLFDEIPINRNTALNIIPVDVAAKMIFILANNTVGDDNFVYHIISPKSFSLTKVINLASDYFNFRKPKFLFKKSKTFHLVNLHKKSLRPILDYFQFEAQLVSQGTMNRLKILGFQFPSINEAFLKRIFSYADKMKYIKVNK